MLQKTSKATTSKKPNAQPVAPKPSANRDILLIATKHQITIYYLKRTLDCNLLFVLFLRNINNDLSDLKNSRLGCCRARKCILQTSIHPWMKNFRMRSEPTSTHTLTLTRRRKRGKQIPTAAKIQTKPPTSSTTRRKFRRRERKLPIKSFSVSKDRRYAYFIHLFDNFFVLLDVF
jgi:hypothetical protein